MRVRNNTYVYMTQAHLEELNSIGKVLLIINGYSDFAQNLNFDKVYKAVHTDTSNCDNEDEDMSIPHTPVKINSCYTVNIDGLLELSGKDYHVTFERV